MPKVNSFYFFLEQVFNQSLRKSVSSSESAESALPLPQLGKSLSQAKFAVIPLRSKNSRVGAYHVTELHMTAFEDLVDKSPYHLTAKLINEEGVEFILHVYFDNNNAIIGDLTSLKAINEEDSQAFELTAHEKRVFHQFATDELSVVKSYRLLQQKRVDDLNKHILAELATISTNSQNNVAEITKYFKKTEVLLELARELHFIGGSKKIIEQVRMIYEKLDWDIAYKKQEKIPVSQKKEDSKENKKKDIQKSKPIKNARIVSKSTALASSAAIEQERVLQEKTDAFNELEFSIKLVIEFGDLWKKNQLKTTSQLVQYHSAVNNALCNLRLCESLDIEVSCEHEINLFRHLNLSRSLGITQLELLLVKGEMPVELSIFVKGLRPEFVRNAVGKKNHELLAWLLKEGNFDLDKIQIADSRGVFINIICYSYKHNDIESFRLLLKYNASLWVPHEGISLARFIKRKDEGTLFLKEISTPKNLRLFLMHGIELLNLALTFPHNKSTKREVDNAIECANSFLKIPDSDISLRGKNLRDNAKLRFDSLIDGIFSTREGSTILSQAVFKKTGYELGILDTENGKYKTMAPIEPMNQTKERIVSMHSIFPKEDNQAPKSSLSTLILS